MYDPISIPRKALHCLSRKGDINIGIFVRGTVNILRWIKFAPLRLLRKML